jgi:hypothetical protein
MNTQQTIIPATSSINSQPTASQPHNASVASLPAMHRHYAWGPASETKSARFFTGHAWGPKKF